MLTQSMNFTMDVAGQFSVLLILSVVGLLLNMTVALVRQRLLFWILQAARQGSSRIDCEGKQRICA